MFTLGDPGARNARRTLDTISRHAAAIKVYDRARRATPTSNRPFEDLITYYLEAKGWDPEDEDDRTVASELGPDEIKRRLVG